MSRRLVRFDDPHDAASVELETVTAPDYSSWVRPAFLLGLAGLAVTALSALLYPPLFFRAYLTAFMLPLGLALGSTALLMINRLTGGAWADHLRPILESAARTIPFLLLLVLPILFGASYLYPWARPHAVDPHTSEKVGSAKNHSEEEEKVLDEKRDAERFNKVLEQKAFWLHYPFWLGRAVGYFFIWIVLIFTLVGGIRNVGAFPTLNKLRRLRTLSAVGLGVYLTTLTLAVIDWTMSLEPEWFSTIYAVMIATGQLLASLAFAVILATLPAMAKNAKPEDTPPTSALHDMGNLLFAFTMLWAYMSFSQYLLIYSGNLPEETIWYLRRLKNGWEWIALLLVFFQFSVPFFVLLSRNAKENPKVMLAMAALMLYVRTVDLFWVIAPAFSAHPIPGDESYSWMLILLQPFTFVGVGGLWFVIFLGQLRQAPPAVLFQETQMEEPAHA